MTEFGRRFIEEHVLPALRDGRYRQCTTGRLKSNGCYCVMGVIANEFMKVYPDSKQEWVLRYNRESSVPDELREYDLKDMRHPDGEKTWLLTDYIAGLLDVTPDMRFNQYVDYGDDESDSLMGLNDAGIDFLELADMLESVMDPESDVQLLGYGK